MDRWYEANRELTINRAKKWVKAHPGRRKAITKKYRGANRKRLNAKAKVYWRINGERINAKRRGNRREESQVRYQAKREHILKIVKAYAEANPEQVAEYKRKWIAKARLDPEFKVIEQQRTRIRWALENQNTRKSSRTIELLCCSARWLVAWLEVQFRPGMTWENHGSGWHVDHIRPCSTFDLTDPQQQKLCFHYTNLQPLFPPENLSKHAKWVGY
jgi:hypothetical protein